ncbi:MAG: ABC transporter substrate-binding protein [Cyanobacteria bacterium P01_B01_bin.77]
MSKIAPTVLMARFESELSLQITAQAVDRVEQAEQVLLNHKQHIASARDQLVSLVATQPKALLLITSQLQEIYLGNSYNSCRLPLEAVGFQLVYPPNFNDKDFESPISLEILPELNKADAIILLGYNFNDLKQLDSMDRFEENQLSKLKQAWEENAISQSLDASQAGRVYFIPTYLCAGLPGPIGTELYLEALKNHLLAPN